MSKRIPTHIEARGCLSRFNSSHWKNNTERARYSIPADPNRDDDILLGNYIDNAEQVAARLETALGLLRNHWLWLKHPQPCHCQYCVFQVTVDADTAREGTGRPEVPTGAETP